MPEHMSQLQVRTLGGATRFLDAEGLQTVGALREWLADEAGLPSTALLRLKCGSRDLACDGMGLAGVGMSVHALLRLPGGKGGFGAMLRTAGAKGVKTTNFDACRDLNGRRLRYVNQEAALREWEAQAEERKRKKQAEKDAKRGPEVNVPKFDDDEYDELLETTRNSVAEAVKASGAAASSAVGADGAGATSSSTGTSGGKKRAAEADAPPAAPPKVAKVFAHDPLAGLDGSSSEEDEEGEAGTSGGNK